MKTNKEILNAGYLNTGRADDNGKPIFEGSIIGADGYNSDLKKHMFYCVEHENGNFTSNIYGDTDHLSRYKSIIVMGHVLDYLDVSNSGYWSGNLGAAIKQVPVIKIYDEARALAVTIEGRKQLRHLIDTVWNHVHEDESVPSTVLADDLINKAFEINKAIETEQIIEDAKSLKIRLIERHDYKNATAMRNLEKEYLGDK